MMDNGPIAGNASRMNDRLCTRYAVRTALMLIVFALDTAAICVAFIYDAHLTEITFWSLMLIMTLIWFLSLIGSIRDSGQAQYYYRLFRM